MRQPGRAELVQFIVSGDWAEDNLWKWRRDGRFAGKANAQAHGDEMHQGVAANIELLHTKSRVMIAVGQPFCEPVTERGIALALAHDEVLVAKIRPLDLVPSAQPRDLLWDMKRTQDSNRRTYNLQAKKVVAINL